MGITVSQKAADNIRILSAAMVEKAASGHPGGAMGGADFIHVLYSEFLNYDPSDMTWVNRDRFFLDPGHMSPMLYSILTLMGHFSLEDLQGFRQWGSHTPGHPEHNVSRGVENTSGPLGQGHTSAVGAAIAERFLAARFGEWMSHKIYTFISAGGVQEEISQGAGRLAGHLGLSNLIMFYDSNEIQLSTVTKAVTSEDTAKKYDAWGWRVYSIDGNDHDQIRGALKKALTEKEKPVIIIGKTIMGKGAVKEDLSSFECQPKTHGQPLSKTCSFAKTVENLGGDSANPFAIFAEVKEAYAKIRDEKIKSAKAKKEIQAKWEKENPELTKKFHGFFTGKAPEIDYSKIEQKANNATRSASGIVLAEFAKQVENMIVGSADLADSDMTEFFLKNTKPFVKGDFSGKFLHCGVSELTMGAVMNGIALHGGIHCACGTFFVFSDYMKPVVRLAALMELPVKYIWTHDAFRVGEDGPTHQPIEQEAQIRLMEKMKNLSGKRSMLVLRPCDSNETTVAWKLAMENTHAPTALILSRQPINDIPALEGSTRYADALNASKGGYIVKKTQGSPDIVLFGNGSEVATLVDAANKIGSRLSIQIVSVISEGLFKEQSEDYRQSVFPFGVPSFGLTSGLPATLEGLAGPFGKVVGMERFGASASFKVLDEKFGYTADNIAKQIDIYLGEYKETLAKVKKFC